MGGREEGRLLRENENAGARSTEAEESSWRGSGAETLPDEEGALPLAAGGLGRFKAKSVSASRSRRSWLVVTALASLSLLATLLYARLTTTRLCQDLLKQRPHGGSVPSRLEAPAVRRLAETPSDEDWLLNLICTYDVDPLSAPPEELGMQAGAPPAGEASQPSSSQPSSAAGAPPGEAEEPPGGQMAALLSLQRQSRQASFSTSDQTAPSTSGGGRRRGRPRTRVSSGHMKTQRKRRRRSSSSSEETTSAPLSKRSSKSSDDGNELPEETPSSFAAEVAALFEKLLAGDDLGPVTQAASPARPAETPEFSLSPSEETEGAESGAEEEFAFEVSPAPEPSEVETAFSRSRSPSPQPSTPSSSGESDASSREPDSSFSVEIATHLRELLEAGDDYRSTTEAALPAPPAEPSTEVPEETEGAESGVGEEVAFEVSPAPEPSEEETAFSRSRSPSPQPSTSAAVPGAEASGTGKTSIFAGASELLASVVTGEASSSSSVSLGGLQLPFGIHTVPYESVNSPTALLLYEQRTMILASAALDAELESGKLTSPVFALWPEMAREHSVGGSPDESHKAAERALEMAFQAALQGPFYRIPALTPNLSPLRVEFAADDVGSIPNSRRCAYLVRMLHKALAAPLVGFRELAILRENLAGALASVEMADLSLRGGRQLERQVLTMGRLILACDSVFVVQRLWPLALDPGVAEHLWDFANPSLAKLATQALIFPRGHVAVLFAVVLDCYARRVRPHPILLREAKRIVLDGSIDEGFSLNKVKGLFDAHALRIARALGAELLP